MTTTCRECQHFTPPAVLDGENPCFDCQGERVVLNGSNFTWKPDTVGSIVERSRGRLRKIITADPDPYENTKAHAAVEVHEADNDAARYVVELETGVWYDGSADGGDPSRTLWIERASRHTRESALACLEYCRSFRPFLNARIVRVEDEADKEER